MSGLPLSTPEWLLTLPDSLRLDIIASADSLASPIQALLDDAASTSHPPDNIASTITPCLSSLERLLSALESSSIARTWSPVMTVGQDLILRPINDMRMWLLLDSTRYPSSPMAVYCCRTIKSIQQDPTAAHLWRTLFDIFNNSPPSPHSVSKPIEGVNQTPLRVSSGNQLSMRTTHDVVDPVLKAELHQLIYIDTPQFFETYFPPQAEAFDACQPFLRKDSTWADWPDDANQDDVIDWFTCLTTALLDARSVRRNYYSSAGRAAIGSHAVRKMDLVLYPTTMSRKNPKNHKREPWTFDFSEVLAVGELKRVADEDTRRNLIIQLAGYVRLIFFSQQYRRFVHAFTLTGDWMRCFIFHRGGAFGSESFSINENPRRFIDVVIGYANMSPAKLGFDTSLVFDKFQFQMNGCVDQFQIEKRAFFIRECIASRGTTCWNVRKKGDEIAKYVLKDSWRNSLYASEATLIEKALNSKVRGIVEVVAFAEVNFDGKPDDIRGNIMKGLTVHGKPLTFVTHQAPDSEKPGIPYTPATTVQSAAVSSISHSGTKSRSRVSGASSNKRKAASGSSATTSRSKRARLTSTSTPQPVLNRIHTRILMHKGRKIYDFTTTRELLYGLHDAIQGHRSLYQDANILHRDISIFNIMLTAPDNPRSDGGRGFLIDLDLAIEVGSAASGALHRTGTMEFMAIEVLRGGSAHTYRHDLESFWYVFVWICVYRHWHHGNRDTPLRLWGGASMTAAADQKRKHIVRGETNGYQTIEDEFHSDCKALAGVADRWRKILFPLGSEGEATVKLDAWVDENPVYDSILKLLKDAADSP